MVAAGSHGRATADPGEKTDLFFEIAYLLFIDFVGYSKLLVNEQVELMQELNRIVRGTECFRAAKELRRLFAFRPATEWSAFFPQPGTTGALRNSD